MTLNLTKMTIVCHFKAQFNYFCHLYHFSLCKSSKTDTIKVGRHDTGLIQLTLLPFRNVISIAIVVIYYLIQVVGVITPTFCALEQWFPTNVLGTTSAA